MKIIKNRLNLAKIKYDNLFIGILSGTSMNSIDAVLVNFDAKSFTILDYINYPFKSKLVAALNIIVNCGECNLSTLGKLDRQLGVEFAKAINTLLAKTKFKPEQIVAIGSHGQNIWHDPRTCSIQIGDPNIISSRSKILTVADFRRKDVALCGQGAPLAPGFHAEVFRDPVKTRAIINLGGISNITILPKNKKNTIIGFDLGPGNCLMDEWVRLNFTKFKLKYDRGGALAAQGKVIPELLKACLDDPYFKKLWPKSTGREYFNQTWLGHKINLARTNINQKLQLNFKLKENTGLKQYAYRKKDVLATLLHLTVNTIKHHIVKFNKLFPHHQVDHIYLCGGGAKNLTLLKVLKEAMSCPVGITDELGLPADLVEAVLFAWLAKQTVEFKCANVPSVTGAKSQSILGGIYLS